MQDQLSVVDSGTIEAGEQELTFRIFEDPAETEKDSPDGKPYHGVGYDAEGEQIAMTRHFYSQKQARSNIEFLLQRHALGPIAVHLELDEDDGMRMAMHHEALTGTAGDDERYELHLSITEPMVKVWIRINDTETGRRYSFWADLRHILEQALDAVQEGKAVGFER